jgi:hypothetical protein
MRKAKSKRLNDDVDVARSHCTFSLLQVVKS